MPALFQGVLDGVNYPELPTIYAPVTQVVFLVAYWVKPASVAVLQAILIAVDLATVLLLLRLAPARNVLLYAWCPLVVKEIAFTAHPDGVGVCLLLAAIVLARHPVGASSRQPRTGSDDRPRAAERHRRWGIAATVLGLAVATKTFALVLAPLILLRARPRHWMLFAGVAAAAYLPFVVLGGTDLLSLGIFARDWEFNSAVFGLLKTVVPPFEARILLGLGFAALWAVYVLRCARAANRESPRRLAVRHPAGCVAGDQSLVSAVALALRGSLSELLGVDGIGRGPAELHHRAQSGRLHVATLRAAGVGQGVGVRIDPSGGRG